ncbi:AGL368Wp [Eremothecium gossypii ATCC 10895]|uniref:AGL368Wp n=1 Tax=Eremothecium gossypii (strain ATCC 10895 / CBS 109.51 / FGSC 9923 / NRRL Y-1056) TaxID=284811 RepID=Q751S2_EREGS|nr:AGL368Wp [Eremothecium gossypii ATCC 10895]AAS54122.1 AGL368Wp [Eremothecium gossypii ATCC 10895]AEY98448.1 FAGL368Wp [Eremothecium gossypii FDAG1]
MLRDIWGLRAARPSQSHRLRDICGGVPAHASDHSGQARAFSGEACNLPVRHENCQLNLLFTLARCHVVSGMLRDIESNTSIEEHKVDEVKDNTLKRYQYRTAICLLFCYVCHVAFCNCVLARSLQLPQDKDSEELLDKLNGYAIFSCHAVGLITLTREPAERLMNRWKLTALALCSIYLVIFDPELLFVSGWLLNFFPSVKSWSLGNIAEYTTWEACAMCLVVAWVSVPAIFKLAFKRVPHKEKEAASSLECCDRVPGTDAESQDDRISFLNGKLGKVFNVVFLFGLLHQVFLVVRSYLDLVKSESFGNSVLYSCALVAVSFLYLVALLSTLFCTFYMLTSKKIEGPFISICFHLFCSYNFLYYCQRFIISTVSLVG